MNDVKSIVLDGITKKVSENKEYLRRIDPVPKNRQSREDKKNSKLSKRPGGDDISQDDLKDYFKKEK